LTMMNPKQGSGGVNKTGTSGWEEGKSEMHMRTDALGKGKILGKKTLVGKPQTKTPERGECHNQRRRTLGRNQEQT